MPRYKFVTIWKLRAPLERVFEAIEDSLAWPRWWPGVEKVVELEKGDESGLGGLRRYTWKGVLPYYLTFDMRVTEINKPRRIKGSAEGELRGVGLWRLAESNGVTTARYDWHVSTTKAWMNLLTPIARPLFAWNHDVLMRQGGEALSRLLGAEILEIKNN